MEGEDAYWGGTLGWVAIVTVGITLMVWIGLLVAWWAQDPGTMTPRRRAEHNQVYTGAAIVVSIVGVLVIWATLTSHQIRQRRKRATM
jgi:hypothetical protein